MDQNNKNNDCSDDFDASVRLTADGKINDYGVPPWPLAPWADRSYLSYGTAPYSPDPNPHDDVPARVARFVDREAAEGGAPRSNSAATNGFSPIGALQPEPTASRPLPHREAPAQDPDTGSESAKEGTIRAAVADPVVEASDSDNLGEWNEWMRSYMRDRNWEYARTLKRSPGRGFDNPRNHILPYAFGLGTAASVAPSPRPFTDTNWPYNHPRLAQASMHDVHAILPEYSREDDEKERRVSREEKEAFRKECEEKRRRGRG